jgi:hypothetical protein
MNGPFHQAPAGPLPSLPAEFESLAPPPLLLPGESLERYHLMRQAILIELAPRSAIEWLLAIDVVELSWEIQRHRLFRQKLLESYRQRAIERTLTQIDTVGIAHSLEEDANFYTRLNALSWRIDPAAADEIEARLASYGFDQHAISTEVYCQAREMYLTFESLLAAAQNRRMMLLREIRNFRSKGDRHIWGPAGNAALG